MCLYMLKLRYALTFMGLDQALYRITVKCKFNEVMVSKIRRLLKEMYCKKFWLRFSTSLEN